MSVPVVYDAMILLMRAARPDRIRPTFELISTGKVQLFVSAAIVEEVRDVLARPAYASRFPALRNPAAAEAFITELSSIATIVADVPDVYGLQRDPKDSKYINLAAAVRAPFLVTRDHDLLDLMNPSSPEGMEFRKKFPQLKILEPAAFIAAIDPAATQ